MENNAALGRLLKIESEAAALVSDARAEADKKISEAEKRNRAAYELRYQEGAAQCEAEFQREISAVRERCQKELSVFRDKMNSIIAHNDRFFAVLGSLFSGES